MGKHELGSPEGGACSTFLEYSSRDVGTVVIHSNRGETYGFAQVTSNGIVISGPIERRGSDLEIPVRFPHPRDTGWMLEAVAHVAGSAGPLELHVLWIDGSKDFDHKPAARQANRVFDVVN